MKKETRKITIKVKTLFDEKGVVGVQAGLRSKGELSYADVLSALAVMIAHLAEEGFPEEEMKNFLRNTTAQSFENKDQGMDQNQVIKMAA